MLGSSHDRIQPSVGRLRRQGVPGRRWLDSSDREETASLTINTWRFIVGISGGYPMPGVIGISD